ncbi:hypothetical protein D3C81_1284000 [compost metagenome]
MIPSMFARSAFSSDRFSRLTAVTSISTISAGAAPSEFPPPAKDIRSSSDLNSSLRSIGTADSSWMPSNFISSQERSTGTSRKMVASCLLMRASSAWFTKFSFIFPFNSSVWASTSSTEPNWCSNFRAVFSPIPGTPGILSEVSPISPFRSMICSGLSPYLSSICCGS